MKLILNWIGQRLREVVYVLLSFPILIALFVFVMFSLGSNLLLPFTILLFLFMLSIMEKVAAFEVRRTNAILRTDFRVVDNWFRSRFFTWEGAKERVTSLRSWMAVSYVFIGFFWSVFSFVILVFGVAGGAGLALGLGVLALSNFNRNFAVEDAGDWARGTITFDRGDGTLRLEFGDGIDSGFISWDFASEWLLALGILGVLLSLLMIPRIARITAELVEALLSGTALPKVQNAVQRFSNRERVSEREVREAMDKAHLQPAIAELSKREREILALMAQGKSNSGIAKTLYITEGSVEKHISNILNKLGLNLEEDSHRRVLAVLKYLGIQEKNEAKDEKVSP